MTPPTLRPHLNDLLQKNLELEHVVADLRHQLTQSSAKWADERKTLAVGCDALMASFAKFRARLDARPLYLADSEIEVEQNLDAGRQSEETSEVDDGMLESERDYGSSTADGLREKCRALAVELRAKEEKLEESQRKREAAEEELQRIQRLLEARSEQSRGALAPSGADTGNKPSPGRAPDDVSIRANSSKAGLESTLEKLDAANQEISRLKQLLQEWKKYGSEWKRDGQAARVRASELQRREDELFAQVRAAEESKALQDMEVQRLISELADQTAMAERQRTACGESVKRVHDLEAVVALLRVRLLPDQLASFDSEQNQAAPGSSSPTQSPTPHTDRNTADPDTNKRSDLTALKSSYHGFVDKPLTENGNEVQDAQQNQALVSPHIRASSAPQQSNNTINSGCTEFEICIHTCNELPCRNDSRSFLWPCKQTSLPRHVLSTKKHHRCAPDCPGYRLLSMPLADAMKEPRKAKCRPPTEAELALAMEETSNVPRDQTGEEVIRGEGEVESERSGEPEGPEGDSTRGEETQERGKEQSQRMGTPLATLGKRLRSHARDIEESQRARKRRPRMSMTAKP